MTDFTAEGLRDFNNRIVAEFRANGGKVGPPFENATLLLLHTTGAKSGQPRLAPLAYHQIDGMIIIVGSKAGADTNPDWVHNLRANPRAHIEVGTAYSYDVVARMPLDERNAVYPERYSPERPDSVECQREDESRRTALRARATVAIEIPGSNAVPNCSDETASRQEAEAGARGNS
jgi:deazaflavin-dependent oxidoreductase (nitroreductase family)